MKYVIEEKMGRFMVRQKGYKSLMFEVCDTKEEAENSVREWEARDKLSDEIDNFYARVIDNYGTVLSEEEIREMIKEGYGG